MDIQIAVKKKCKEKSISLKSIAGSMGISNVTLWKKLSGQQDIKVADLKMVSEALNCDFVLEVTSGEEKLTLIDRE
jgi:transcriptional regulator with XRE-family HTH domain